MRFLLALIVVLLAIFYFMKEPAPRPVEEPFIGEQLEPLRKAENFEDEYLESVKEQQKKMEEELEKAGGG